MTTWKYNFTCVPIGSDYNFRGFLLTHSAQIGLSKLHKPYFHGWRSPQFVVPRYHNILEVTERLFTGECHHSLLWPEATIFLMSKRGYSRSEDATVYCAQMPQQLKSKRKEKLVYFEVTN